MSDQIMQPIKSPQWMLELFKAIDTLDMSESGGLSCFAENIEMHSMPARQRTALTTQKPPLGNGCRSSPHDQSCFECVITQSGTLRFTSAGHLGLLP
jgi:hypothetical protein